MSKQKQERVAPQAAGLARGLAGACLAWLGASCVPAWGDAPAAAPPPASVVLRHGVVYTMDAQRHVASAVAWRGNEIVAVGRDDEVRRWIGPRTRVVDLQGAMVLPGFVDAHVHPLMGAINQSLCDLQSENLPADALVRAARACLARTRGAAPGRWFQVVGISAIGVHIDRQLVDRIARDRPVVLWGGEGHTAWLNGAALAASHIERARADPPGGHIGHDADGEPDGYLVDNALSLVKVPPPSLAEALPLARKGLAALTAAGITAFQDADTSEFERSVYAELERRGELHQRVVVDQHQEPAYDAAAVAAAVQVRERFRDDPLIRADAVKLFLDGTLEYPYQTAALLTPYLDADGKPTANDGGRYFDPAQLAQVVQAFDALGFTVHYHVIGDRAAREGLDAIEAAMASNGSKDRRHQLSHIELIDPADIARMARLGVIANLQLYWALPDVWSVDAVLPYVGPERHRTIYAARSMQAAGVRLAGGSDWPVSTFDPLQAMRQALTRSYPSDAPAINRSRRMDVLYAQERLDIGSALAMYTTDAAYALRLEDRAGSLETGKRADLVVLDRDLTTLEASALTQAKVACTVFDGQLRYRRDRRCGP